MITDWRAKWAAAQRTATRANDALGSKSSAPDQLQQQARPRQLRAASDSTRGDTPEQKRAGVPRPTVPRNPGDDKPFIFAQIATWPCHDNGMITGIRYAQQASHTSLDVPSSVSSNRCVSSVVLSSRVFDLCVVPRAQERVCVLLTECVRPLCSMCFRPPSYSQPWAWWWPRTSETLPASCIPCTRRT